MFRAFSSPIIITFSLLFFADFRCFAIADIFIDARHFSPAFRLHAVSFFDDAAAFRHYSIFPRRLPDAATLPMSISLILPDVSIFDCCRYFMPLLMRRENARACARTRFHERGALFSSLMFTRRCAMPSSAGARVDALLCHARARGDAQHEDGRKRVRDARRSARRASPPHVCRHVMTVVATRRALPLRYAERFRDAADARF
jgi:hypothetical protein